MVRQEMNVLHRFARACAVSALICLVSLGILVPVLAQKPAESPGEGTELPDLTITAIKPYHYKWSEEYGLAMGEPFFNLLNYVNVTVRNNGTATAEAFEVALYADGEPIGSETIADLRAGKERELRFAWTPEGEDPLRWTDTAQGAKLTYRDTNRNYTLSAVADEDEKVQELNETNNELAKKQEVVWNGFMADQPLEEYAQDVVNGGILFTTGDAVYRSDDSRDSGTVYGKPYAINYNLQIPGSTKLARFYIYYTWAEPEGSAPKGPKIGVTLKTPAGKTVELSLDKSYNEIKGDFQNYRFHAWGTYAYDITNQVRENGTYVVTIENINDGSDADFTDEYSFAAPAILVVYEDNAAPKREYWINEGADVLMGGREIRPEGGFLGLDECRNSAEFAGEHQDLEVESAAVGVVSPWADDSEDDLIEFNGRELGKGLYNGYFDPWSKDLPGLSMEVGADEAQQGAAAIDVTRYLDAEDNEVVQGDDGDNMMSVNAFLVITYKEKAEEEEGGSSGGSSAKESTPATSTSTSAAPAATVTKATRSIPRLEAEKEVAMIFPDMDVSLLVLTADTNVSDAKVVVERIEKPYALPEPAGVPYVYLEVQVECEQETARITGRIEFKVAESWLTANKIDENSVTLNRYHNREGWTALPTTKVGEEENSSIYFEAATQEFSIFAVTGVEKPVSEFTSTPTPTAEQEVPRPSMPLPTATSQPTAQNQSNRTGGLHVPGFDALSGGAAILALLYRWKRRRRADRNAAL